jgi:hypothetical protein
MMKLMTKAIEKRIPELRGQDGKSWEETTVYAKFFNPVGHATWFATEYDPEERMFFGWAELHPGCGELGYFSLDELESVRLRFGLGIERDRHFPEKSLADCVAEFQKLYA